MKNVHNTRRSAMQVSVEAILAARGQLENFNTPNKNGAFEFHLRIDNKPYLPLVIERHGPIVAICHYSMKNGDAIKDPEIVFNLPTWEAAEITQDPMHLWRAKRFFRDGKPMVDARFEGDVMPLVNAWAKEMRAQGFASSGSASSLTHHLAEV